MPMFCFVAHDPIYHDVKTLYYDISVENIMILGDEEEEEGFLIDWDICIYIEEEAEP